MTIDRDNARALIEHGRRYAQLGKPETYKETVDALASAKALLVRFADALEAALSAVPVEGEVGDHEPCEAELWSWDYFKHQQVDAYWMRCHELGKHDEHKNSETGAHWPVEVAP